MLRSLLLTLPVLAITALETQAQRPTPVVTGRLPIITVQPQLYPSPYSQVPVYNPTPSINIPVVLPATWAPPVLIPTHFTEWGTIQPARLIPGVYTPPLVATVEPSRYFPVAQWTAINPTNGNVFDAWNNTFTNRDGSYQYNPWTNTYTNPLNNATYNPHSGVTIRPLSPVASPLTNYNNFYNRGYSPFR